MVRMTHTDVCEQQPILSVIQQLKEKRFDVSDVVVVVVTEHVMKTLQSIESTDEKLSALCKKYAELLEEHRTTQGSLKQTQRTLSVVSEALHLRRNLCFYFAPTIASNVLFCLYCVLFLRDVCHHCSRGDCSSILFYVHSSILFIYFTFHYAFIFCGYFLLCFLHVRRD